MNPFETRRNFLKQAGVLTVGALLAACAPQSENQSSPVYDPLPSGLFQIEPNESFSTINFAFNNGMNSYSVRLDLGILQDVLSHYQIETRFQQGNKISIELVEDTFTTASNDGVMTEPSLDKTERIKISGGYMETLIKNGTGHLPQDLRDQTILSTFLSIEIVGGMAMLAENRGDLPVGSARKIEDQYTEDILNINELLVAGMQILAIPTAPSSSLTG